MPSTRPDTVPTAGLCRDARAEHALRVARTGVLVVVVVGDGRWSASSCIESAAATRGGAHDVELLVIDDRHPDEVTTNELAERCEDLAVMHYRSPRRLGAPRASNLAFGRATTEGYDHVLLVRRSVLLPQRIAEVMIKVAEANPGVGSVAAWSNGGSPVIPNGTGRAVLRRHGRVDWIAGELADEFGSTALDIPASDGSCLLIPVPVLVKVGQFDPVYASGHFDAVDWCLRSRERARRVVLAPAAFVVEADDCGPVPGAGDVAVSEEERIIDMRYPWRRADQCAFDSSGSLETLSDRAVRAIVVGAASRLGYEVEATWIATAPDAERARFVVDPDGRSGTAGLEYCGFRTDVEVPGADLPAMIENLTGAAPARVILSDRGLFADQLTAAWADKVPFIDGRRYPQRV